MQRRPLKSNYAHENVSFEDENSNQYAETFDPYKYTKYGKQRLNLNQSSLQEIDNTMSWRESLEESRDPDNESEEVKFLKEKLIETHSKLLKEVENSNQLAEQTQKLDKEIKLSQKANKELQESLNGLEKEINDAHKKISNFEKGEEKYKSVEHKLEEESRKNSELKEEVENMRNKMLEAITNKNNIEEMSIKVKSESMATLQSNQHLEYELINNNSLINKLQTEVESLKQANSHLNEKTKGLQKELQDLQTNSQEQKKYERELIRNLEQEQKKVNNLTEVTNELKKEIIDWQCKSEKMQKVIDKNREELAYIDNRKDIINKDLIDQIKHLTQELEHTKIIHQQSETEMEFCQNKPTHQPDKRKTHLKITKEPVNQHDNQEELYENVGSQGTTYSALRNFSLVNHQHEETKIGSRQASYQNSKISAHKNSYIDNYKEEEAKELETVFVNCNLERKKIKAEIDRIEENKVKTREMMVKKRRLNEELQYQEEKIKKVKEELGRLRMP